MITRVSVNLSTLALACQPGFDITTYEISTDLVIDMVKTYLCLYVLTFVDCMWSIRGTVRLGGMGTGISEASKRVPIFSFATQGGKQVSSHFRQRNWVQAREAQIRFPAG